MFGSRARRLDRRVAELEAAAGPLGKSPAPAVAANGGGGDPWSWLYASSVQRAQAMAVPTLAYIRAQLAGGVSAMPLERFRKDPGGGEPTKLDPGWTADPDPAPTISSSLFWGWVIDDLFFSGKATLVVLARDATGFPVAFRRVLPGQIQYMPEVLAWGTFTGLLLGVLHGRSRSPRRRDRGRGPARGDLQLRGADHHVGPCPGDQRGVGGGVAYARTSICTRPAANLYRRTRPPS